MLNHWVNLLISKAFLITLKTDSVLLGHPICNVAKQYIAINFPHSEILPGLHSVVHMCTLIAAGLTR